MSKIESITSENIKGFHLEVKAAVSEVLAKYGMIIDQSKCGYTSDKIDFKFKTRLMDAPSAKEEKDSIIRSALEKYYPEWVDKEITMIDRNYTIIGLDFSKRKFPIILQGSNGKQYKASIIQIQNALRD